MKCRRSRKLIAESVWGTIAPAEQKALDEHLRACADCNSERKQIVALLDSVSRREDSDPGEAYWTAFNRRVFERISWHQDEKPWSIRMPVRMRYALATTAIILTVVIALFLYAFFATKGLNPARYEARVLEAMQTVGVEQTSDVAECIVPFYQDESVYSSLFDPINVHSSQEANSEHAPSDGLVPYSLIEDLDDSESEALRTQIESEMI